MKDKREIFCKEEEMDRIHHVLEHQIAYICVEEEEEEMRREAKGNDE